KLLRGEPGEGQHERQGAGSAERRLATLAQFASIGVGRAAVSPLPLPPNRTGGFPASGSPVSRSSVGLTKRTVGCAQVKQTQVREVGVGPAMMIPAATTAATSRPPAQDAAHPHAHPFVQSGERRPVTVFEVVKPAP